MTARVQFRFSSSDAMDTYEMTKRSIGPYDSKGPPLGSRIKATQYVTNTITGYTGCSKGTVLRVTSRGNQGVVARYQDLHAQPVILLHDEYERVSKYPSTGIFAEDDDEGTELPLGTARWLKPSKQ